jgi:hypothetical protein
MLQAYFDDSSSENSKCQKRAFVLAGFLSMAERWNAFSDEWDRALDDLPDRKRGGRKRLKMSAAMSARSRGSNSRAFWDALLSKCQSIIERHAMLGFGCVVGLDAFEEHLKSNDDRVLVQRAYQIALFGGMGATMRYHKEKALTEKVNFVLMTKGPPLMRRNARFWISGGVSLT